jgi:hypothetical protein
MERTLEVRWFYNGEPDDALVDWFEQLGATLESERTDLYLLTDDPARNVKVREGKVQVKCRGTHSDTIRFHPQVVGLQERWDKWSFDLATDRMPDLPTGAPNAPWVPVKKRRLQRTFNAEEQLDLLSAPIESRPVEAQIELTKVRSGEHVAWTVCVESEGAPRALPGTLEQMGQHLFGADTPVTLEREASCGYAGWLMQVYADSPNIAAEGSLPG